MSVQFLRAKGALKKKDKYSRPISLVTGHMKMLQLMNRLSKNHPLAAIHVCTIYYIK